MFEQEIMSVDLNKEFIKPSNLETFRNIWELQFTLNWKMFMSENLLPRVQDYLHVHHQWLMHFAKDRSSKIKVVQEN